MVSSRSAWLISSAWPISSSNHLTPSLLHGTISAPKLHVNPPGLMIFGVSNCFMSSIIKCSIGRWLFLGDKAIICLMVSSRSAWLISSAWPISSSNHSTPSLLSWDYLYAKASCKSLVFGMSSSQGGVFFLTPMAC